MTNEADAQIQSPNHNDKTLRIELFIARLLRWGVTLSFVVVAIGIVAVIITGQTGYSQIRLDDVNSIVQYGVHPNFPNSLNEEFTGLLALKPYAIIVLGLLILISIPVVRVAISIGSIRVSRRWS